MKQRTIVLFLFILLKHSYSLFKEIDNWLLEKNFQQPFLKSKNI